MRSLSLAGRRAERAHVVQAVRQLDDDHANVVDHGQQHLADALGLPFLARGEIDLAQFGDAIHAARHFLAELLRNFARALTLVSSTHIVQQAGLRGRPCPSACRPGYG